MVKNRDGARHDKHAFEKITRQQLGCQSIKGRKMADNKWEKFAETSTPKVFIELKDVTGDAGVNLLHLTISQITKQRATACQPFGKRRCYVSDCWAFGFLIFNNFAWIFCSDGSLNGFAGLI